jgi:hypothetical protein
MLGPARRAVNELRAGFGLRNRFGLRALVWAVLLVVLAVALQFVPLFDVLGYDFCFALGLAAALAAVDVGHGLVALRGRPADAPALVRLCSVAAGIAAVLLVPPLLISVANAVRVRNCSFGAGFGFFVLLPLATVAYAAPAGVLAAMAVPRRRWGRALAFAVPVASLLWSLLRLYADPPVFAYDPFGGYFPGPIYDEALRPPMTLLCFRLVNLVWIAAAVAIAAAAVGRGWNARRWHATAAAVATPLLVASIVLYAMGGRLQFRITRADLERTLDRTITTDHFLLHYAQGAKTRADVALTAEDLEFRYHQLHETLGVEPRLPITVWEFPSAEVKKALVGAGGTLYAKPWTREIFVQTTRFPARVLRHEMAHVFAGTFGDRFFGMSLAWRWHGPLPLPALSGGLIEGVAEAASSSDPDEDATIHEQARAMIEAGLAPPLSAVMGAGFSTQAGRRAYTMAGSFASFLLATRGAERLRALYRSAGDFSDVYHVPLADLEKEWREFLAQQPLTTRERARASEEFRRPAIFKRVCARELAARLVEARAIERGDPERAVAILEATCHDDPAEPSYRLALAEALALAGQRARALVMLGRLAVDADVTVPLRAQANALAAEINFVARDYVRADNEEKRAAELASSEAERRQALAKLRGLASPVARSTLGRALFGDEEQPAGADPVLTFYLITEYARLVPADMLGPYLVGRQLLARDPARALPHLARACDDSESRLPPEFLRECRRMMVDAAYRIGDFPRARATLDRAVGEATGEADRLRALDMRERVDWAAARRAGPVAGDAP